MNTAKSIVRNTVLLLSSKVTSQVINFFYVMLTARFLGAEAFGILSFALAFTGIFGIFTDLGVKKILVRDLARDRSLIDTYLGKVLIIKILLNMIVIFMIIFFINLLNYPEITKRVVYILCFSIIIGSFVEMFYAIYQSHENLTYESFGQVLRFGLLVAGALYAISKGFSVQFFALLYLFSNIIILIYCVLFYFNQFSMPKIQIDMGFMKTKMKEAISFGLIGVFEIIYHWVDTVMLSMMKGDIIVGWYNVAYRTFQVTLFIPSVISLVVFPVMSRYYISSEDLLKTTYEKYFKYLTVVGVPIGIGITLLADKIILLVFGHEYSPSIIALQILIWSTVFIFINSAFIRLFESTNRQLVVTKICGSAAVLNVLLNLLFIPKYSYIGASIATIMSEFLITLSVIILANRTKYKIKYSTITGHLFKVSLAGLVFGICIYYLMSLVSLLLTLIFSTFIYFIILYFARGISREDLKGIRSLCQHQN